MTDWSALLAAEEARAMAGKPAFRVRMACVAGVACPRCRSPVGTRCGAGKMLTSSPPKSPTTCRERVWAMRALQRSPAMSRPPRVADVAGFLDAVAGHIAGRDMLLWVPALSMWTLAGHTETRVSDGNLDAAIRHGLVRLEAISDGRPVWVITDAGAEYAAGWKR